MLGIFFGLPLIMGLPAIALMFSSRRDASGGSQTETLPPAKKRAVVLWSGAFATFSSADGRATVGEFMRAGKILWHSFLFIWIAGEMLSAMVRSDPFIASVAPAVVWVPVGLLAFNVFAKRLHDLNLSAAWAAAPIGLLGVATGIWGGKGFVLDGSVTSFAVGAVVVYSVLGAALTRFSGDSAPNRFGERVRSPAKSRP